MAGGAACGVTTSDCTSGVSVFARAASLADLATPASTPLSTGSTGDATSRGISLCTNRCGSANSVGLSSEFANDDARVELAEAIQPHGEIMRHADAAMRRSM